MKNNKSIKRITVCAMLIALSTVIGIVCKNLFTFGLFYRITFENLPVIFASITLGPLYGAVVGLCSDIISCISSVNPALNPIITLGAVCVGIFAGAGAKLVRNSLLKRIIFAAACGHLVGQVIVKSVGKIIYFGMPWWGTLVGFAISAFICVFEISIIYLLLRNNAVRNYMERLK